MCVGGESAGFGLQEVFGDCVDAVDVFVVCHGALILIRMWGRLVIVQPASRPIKLNNLIISINAVQQRIRLQVLVALRTAHLPDAPRLSRHTRTHLGRCLAVLVAL